MEGLQNLFLLLFVIDPLLLSLQLFLILITELKVEQKSILQNDSLGKPSNCSLATLWTIFFILRVFVAQKPKDFAVIDGFLRHGEIDIRK